MLAMARRPLRKQTKATAGQVRLVAQAEARVKRVQAWRKGLFLAVLMLVAVALRTANLTRQSLWADEGNSVRLTERSLSLVIAAARADIHPPGYYLLLWGWVKLFGQGEVAVRTLSVVSGVALVGLVYLLGRRWLGSRCGWLAAFCAAVSPLQIEYSQEVRMYILAALLGTVATYALVRWMEWGNQRERTIWSVVYVLSAAAGLWTHYSFPVVIAALNIALLVWWLERQKSLGWRQPVTWWLAMHMAVLVLYLPWLPVAWAKTWGYAGISASYSVSFTITQGLKLLSVGQTAADDDVTRWLVVGIVGLAVFGAWGGFAARRSVPSRPLRAYTLGLVLLAMMPMALMVALTIAGRPAYRPKFFLVGSPAFCVLVGGGIAALEKTSENKRALSNQLWLLLGLGLVGVGAARSLRNYYYDPAYARADYRGMAAAVARMEYQGDAILLDAPNQWEVFTYYYRGDTPVYPLCRSRPCSEAQTDAELAEIAVGRQRLFALYWATEESDPERVVERWLGQHAFKASDTWYGDVRLVVYGVDQGSMAGEPSQSRPAVSLEDVRLGDTIALRGYNLPQQRVRRGGVLPITLFWEAMAVPAGRYKVFLHLVSAGGQLVAQVDSEPGNGMNLTSSWRPEQGVFADRYGVLVPETASSGQCQLLVGMYEVSGAPRLPIQVNGDASGDALPLATVEVQ
jgi:mannosyltransferase